MKKILFLLFATVSCFTGCSIDDDDRVNVIYPLVPIETATVPDTLIAGTEYTVELTYQLPTECHTFNDIIAEEEDNLIYIGVRSMFEAENPNCEETNSEMAETSFQFIPTNKFNSYIFKFWQAENEAGEAIYLTKEIPVKTEGNDI